MRYPTDNNRITSQYGYRMIGGVLDFHGGTDYGAETPRVEGDDIIGIADNGRVRYAGFDNARGYNIIIEHVSHCTRYGHLKEMLVKEGDIVNEGEVFAKMGSTGRSTAAHLHFEVHECKYENFHEKWPNGEAKHTIDPELFFMRYIDLANKNKMCAEMQRVILEYC